MKPKAKNFIFTSCKIEPEKKRAVFNYRIEFANRPSIVFTERINFAYKININKVPSRPLKSILDSVHLILGISYYKLYCPRKIKTPSITLSKEQAEFWNTVYHKGLGEFFYRNKIDSKNLISFPYGKTNSVACNIKRKSRALLGIGGGKDSIVAAELLKAQNTNFDALLIETQKESPISAAVIEKLKIGKLIMRRYLDEKIFQPHESAYNGHIPISAVFAFLGYLAAVLYDYSYVIVANEYSSNFGNIKYKGDNINHQWSKSAEFESLFQKYTKNFICPDIIYFSALRALSEIRITEFFSKYKKYFSLFSSCNRSFKARKKRPENLWCGECPKCVFMFIMLSAFLSKKDLLNIFKNNLYDKESLSSLFADILGFGKMKPFDCVGTFKESQAALYLAEKQFKGSLILGKFLPKIKNPKKLIKNVFETHSAPTLPANFKFIGARNVLVLGYGKEGRMTVKYIRKNFPKLKIKISDKKNSSNYLQGQENFDLAIKTPGIPKQLVKIPYTTATNLFFPQIKNMIIGVTGSKGKSTTSSLIYSILKEAGNKVRLLGNIGNPMLKILMEPIDPDEIFVIELSSYQLDDIEYSPHIAVMLNFFPEHMNYHGNVEKYYEAKKNILRSQKIGDYFVYNERNDILKSCVGITKATGVTFNGDMDISKIKNPLRGSHNEENVKAAITVSRLLKIPENIIIKAIEKFKPLPHRLEYIGEHKGIKFYDDAISTTPESTMMALEALPRVKTIFLGGEDRGYEFHELENKIREKHVENIVLFPDTGKRILKSKKGFNILNTSSMKEAVEFAYKHTPVGTKCLLSMASPSYSLWNNFEEKGKQFQYFVKKLSR